MKDECIELNLYVRNEKTLPSPPSLSLPFPPFPSLSLQWTNRVFGLDSPTARVICLLAAGDPKPEVQEEARSGLDLERILAALSTTTTPTTTTDNATAPALVAGSASPSRILVFLDNLCDLFQEHKRSILGRPDTRVGTGAGAEAGLDEPLALHPRAMNR